MKIYDVKIVRSGNIIEIYKYKKLQIKNTKDKKNLKNTVSSTESSLSNEKKVKSHNSENNKLNFTRFETSILRSKRMIRRLIDANVNQYNETDKFVTLTFKEKDMNKLTRDYVFYSLKEFMRKMYDMYGKFEYIAVIEKGETGTKRLHLHLVCFGLKYLHQTKLQKIWSKGIVDIRKIEVFENSSYSISSYMTKYISKTLSGDYIPQGKKFYSTSRGLKKPLEDYLTIGEYEKIEGDLGKEVFKVDCENYYVGKFEYLKRVTSVRKGEINASLSR